MQTTSLPMAEHRLPENLLGRLETLERDLASLKRLEGLEERLAPLDRLVVLEKDLAALKHSTSIRQTPVYGFALFFAVGAFIVLILNLPFDGDPDMMLRLLIGAACLFVTAAVFTAALGFVKFALKALVEIAAALLLLATASLIALLWLSFPSFTAWVHDLDLSSPENASAVAIAVAAIGLFLVDALVLFFLYPMAQSARTSLEPPS